MITKQDAIELGKEIVAAAKYELQFDSSDSTCWIVRGMTVRSLSAVWSKLQYKTKLSFDFSTDKYFTAVGFYNLQ